MSDLIISSETVNGTAGDGWTAMDSDGGDGPECSRAYQSEGLMVRQAAGNGQPWSVVAKVGLLRVSKHGITLWGIDECVYDGDYAGRWEALKTPTGKELCFDTRWDAQEFVDAQRYFKE